MQSVLVSSHAVSSTMHRSVRLCKRHGFSLVEAVIATSIITIASSVLLLGVESTFSSVDQSEEQTIADGLARQMLDEIQGNSWVDPEQRADPYPIDLLASASELAAVGRTLFDDNDDYNDYIANPPLKRSGDIIATFTAANGTEMPLAFKVRDGFVIEWKVETRISYVTEDDISVETETPSNYRVAVCTVYHRDPDGTWQTVTQRKRILCYVPAS